jgi:glycosyltransferase involved in cell wall biosynthesis
MRILLANKFYYPRGGDCIYTIALESLLKSKGIDVGMFSMQHNSNIHNQYDNYWPSALEYSAKNIKNIKESIFRPLFSREVENKFSMIIRDFKPDILHLNNIHTQLSPVIAKIAFENNIPVIWTLHDFKLICPAYSCLRDGVPCELCFADKKNVLRHKCIKNSLIGSTIAYFEAIKWNTEKLQRYTKYFICPSEFMKQKMTAGGFDSKKLIVLNNFISKDKIHNTTFHKENYYCYVGRLSPEKGIKTLLEVAVSLKNFKLKIIGTGPLEDELKKNYTGAQIEYLGFKEWAEIKEILSKAMFSVLPTECYENFPTSVIESMILGTTVIGSRIGGIPEMIDDGINGLLFNPGDKKDLLEKINLLFNDNLLMERLSLTAKANALKQYDPETYYGRLIEVYNKIQNGVVLM